MLGLFVIFIAICIILAEKEMEFDRMVKPYQKAKRRNKYGCWIDGYQNYHFGKRDKICFPFEVGGHNILATAKTLSYSHGGFTEFDELARDLTLEKEVRVERKELECFQKDMEARKEAVKNGKEFYETSIKEKGFYFAYGSYFLFRQCEDNRLYCTWSEEEHNYYKGIHKYKLTKIFYGANLLNVEVSPDGKLEAELIEVEVQSIPDVSTSKEAYDYFTKYGIYSEIKSKEKWNSRNNGVMKWR